MINEQLVLLLPIIGLVMLGKHTWDTRHQDTHWRFVFFTTFIGTPLAVIWLGLMGRFPTIMFPLSIVIIWVVWVKSSFFEEELKSQQP